MSRLGTGKPWQEHFEKRILKTEDGHWIWQGRMYKDRDQYNKASFSVSGLGGVPVLRAAKAYLYKEVSIEDPEEIRSHSVKLCDRENCIHSRSLGHGLKNN